MIAPAGFLGDGLQRCAINWKAGEEPGLMIGRGIFSADRRCEQGEGKEDEFFHSVTESRPMYA